MGLTPGQSIGRAAGPFLLRGGGGSDMFFPAV